MGFFETTGGGGLIGGISNLLSSGIQALSANAQQKKQEAHDKEMAGINQANVMEQMSKQNEYQLEQWNRENVYNDPSAVAQRYRSAGINPRSALGGAVTGAGIAGGFSSAPSGSSTGHASNIMTQPFAGLSSLGSDIMSGMRLHAQNAKDVAGAQLDTEKSLSEMYERNYIKPSEARLRALLADTQASESEIMRVEAQWKPYMMQLESLMLETNIGKLDADTKLALQKLEESASVVALNEETRNKVIAEAKEIAERTKGYVVERAYKQAITELTSSQKYNVAMDTALKAAQHGHTTELKKFVMKEAELIASKIKLTDAQTDKYLADISQGWSKFAKDTTKATSEEVRKWLFGWIPFANP